MSIRVSVVVAVYNVGEFIQPLVESLDAQTLPADQFEVIFVDDGSTDDTAGRLDRIGAERANVTVVHEPNSGWPGRPRNIGTDHAKGKYVLFVDHDDWLGREALQRMTDYADANGSDIVIGRYAGHHRGVAKGLFSKSRPNATLAEDPLIDSLTPHKMFRAEFLRNHELRFPEGRRRLEDHVFVVRAYFLAERISVLADYHCYFHIGRPDGGNAGYQRIDPASYYGYVREVSNVILKYTEPGDLRDRLLRRQLRQELLGRLDGKSFLRQDRDYQERVFEEARALVSDLMPLSVDAGLNPAQRARAAFLRQDRLDDLLAYVARNLGTKALVRLLDVRWDADGELCLELEGSLVDDTGQPWAQELEWSVGPGSARLQLVLRRRENSEEWPIPTDLVVQLGSEDERPQGSLRAAARFDPHTIAGGQPLTAGAWDFYAVLSQAGLSRERRLGATRSEQATRQIRPAIFARLAMVPYWTQTYDNLSLDVAAGGGRFVEYVRFGRAHYGLDDTPDGAKVQLTLLCVIGSGQQPPRVQVRLSNTATGKFSDVEATTSGRTQTEWSLEVRLPPLSVGLWQLLLLVDVLDWGKPCASGATIRISAGRAPAILSDAAVSQLSKPSTLLAATTWAQSARKMIRRLRRGVRRRLRRP